MQGDFSCGLGETLETGHNLAGRVRVFSEKDKYLPNSQSCGGMLVRQVFGLEQKGTFISLASSHQLTPYPLGTMDLGGYRRSKGILVVDRHHH